MYRGYKAGGRWKRELPSARRARPASLLYVWLINARRRQDEKAPGEIERKRAIARSSKACAAPSIMTRTSIPSMTSSRENQPNRSRIYNFAAAILIIETRRGVVSASNEMPMTRCHGHELARALKMAEASNRKRDRCRHSSSHRRRVGKNHLY